MGSQLRFFWYPGPVALSRGHIEEAAAAFFKAISPPSRFWDPRQRAMAMSEFKATLVKGTLGALKPVEQVDPTEAENVYEIRFRDLRVVTENAHGERTYSGIEVRMYHSEPSVFPDCFVGHIVHEKVIDKDSAVTRKLQDIEIDAAARIRDLGENVKWGIAA